MPSPVITFKNAFDFMALKKLGRTGKRNQIYLLAEGLIGGKVVATYRMDAALKPTKLRLRIDNDNKPLIADGSDVVVVIAELTDDAGNVKRLNNDYIRFAIEGEGRLLQPNPIRSVKADWGSAPVLLQSTSVAGKIKIRAELECEGISTAHAVELEIVSVPSSSRFIVDNRELATQRIQNKSTFVADSQRKIVVTEEMKAKLDAELKKVEQQQEQFGEKELK
jgi:beta-galactosidase